MFKPLFALLDPWAERGGGPLVDPLPLGIEPLRLQSLNRLAVMRTTIGQVQLQAVNRLAVLRLPMFLQLQAINRLAVLRVFVGQVNCQSINRLVVLRLPIA